MALTKVTGSVIKDSVSLSGNVSIGGTLTYQDVTNVDALGIGTFRTGINVSGGQLDVGSNIKIGNAGIITATELDISGDIDVDGHTNLDNVSIVGVSTFTGNVIVDSGTVRCNDGFSSDVDLIFNADANNNGTGSIIFKESGSEKLRITSAGRLGIGENSPDTMLHVTGSDNVLGLFESTDADSLIQFKDNSTSDTILVGALGGDDLLLRCDAGNLIFNLGNNSEKARFDSSGRLLIGTTTEGHAAGDNLTVADSGNAGITIRSGSSNNGSLYFSDGTSGSAEYRGAVRYNHTDNYLQFYTNGSEKLRIDSNGNIGVNCTPATSGTLYNTVDHFIAIGDSDTGIAQDGDGQLELWANNENIADFNTGQVTLKKVTVINNSIGVGILPQTSGSGTQFGARTYKIAIGDNDTGIAQNGDGNLCFYSNNEEIIRIDSSISGVVKNNFLLKEFQRHDTSSQHGPLSTSFSTDGNISATISNYQRGQRIIIRATVPCGIALQNSSGANYAGTTARIKLSNGSNSTYSNDRASWYRADGSGVHETTQNLFICLYLNESNTDFNNGDTLTVTIEGKKNSGSGSSTHYIGGWSSSKELTVERYERAL